MARHLQRISDLDDDEIDALVAPPLEGGAPPAGARPGPLVGLVFFEPSLRTRVGFAAAAVRLGGAFVEVDAARDGPATSAESLVDTVRTVSDYVDVVVVRPGVALDGDTLGEPGCPVVNGGDSGPRAEHPTQALIDLVAIRATRGDEAGLRVAVQGDLRMRATRSLLALLARRPPRDLVVITDESLVDRSDPVLTSLGPDAFRRPGEVDDVDVLYVAGIPHQALPLDARSRLIVDDAVVGRLPADAVVLSPMPVIDEIAPSARRDPRVVVHQQSAHGMVVRRAVLALLRG